MTAREETRAEAFRGAVAPEGIALEFGLVGEPAAAGATTVRLTDRVVLPLETAQRLVIALDDCLRRLVPPSGSTGAGAPATPSRGEIPVNAAADPAGEEAGLLMQLVARLQVPFQHERSFSLSEGELAGNRFLLTVARQDIGEEPVERVLDIGRRLGMPPSVEPDIERGFHESRCIHFGFEARGASRMCKVYLEREFGQEDAERACALSRPILLHLAFKWNVAAPTPVVSRYFWHPRLASDEIAERLEGIYSSGANGVSLDIAKAVLRLAESRTPAQDLQYLEVTEDANERRSFDLNLYAANLQVKDIQHLLSRMRAHYGIRPGQFQALFDQVRGRSLGHIAGGMHRDGRDFFTVYYGVEGYPRFSGVSGPARSAAPLGGTA